MDAKITMSFNKEVISDAKLYAKKNNISLSRLTEFLYRKLSTSTKGKLSLEDIPVADWINELSMGEITYKTKPMSRKAMKSEFYNHKK